jgi:hypothetical protein
VEPWNEGESASGTHEERSGDSKGLVSTPGGARAIIGPTLLPIPPRNCRESGTRVRSYSPQSGDDEWKKGGYNSRAPVLLSSANVGSSDAGQRRWYASCIALHLQGTQPHRDGMTPSCYHHPMLRRRDNRPSPSTLTLSCSSSVRIVSRIVHGIISNNPTGSSGPTRVRQH